MLNFNERQIKYIYLNISRERERKLNQINKLHPLKFVKHAN